MKRAFLNLRTFGFVVVAASAMLVYACGGDEESSEETTEETTEESTEETTEETEEHGCEPGACEEGQCNGGTCDGAGEEETSTEE